MTVESVAHAFKIRLLDNPKLKHLTFGDLVEIVRAFSDSLEGMQREEIRKRDGERQ